jgi:hypothetical protein
VTVLPEDAALPPAPKRIEVLSTSKQLAIPTNHGSHSVFGHNQTAVILVVGNEIEPGDFDVQAQIGATVAEALLAAGDRPGVDIEDLRNRALYFGCWGREPGHFFRSANGQRLGYYEQVVKELPFDGVDNKLTPQKGELGREVQGAAKLTVKGGWTALAFADRSVDTRGASNAAFIFHAELNFEQALEAARALFPPFFERIDYDIVDHRTLPRQ